MYPGENLLLVLLDLLCAYEHFVCDLTRDHKYTVDVTKDDITWLDGNIAYLDRILVVGDEAALSKLVAAGVSVCG